MYLLRVSWHDSEVFLLGGDTGFENRKYVKKLILFAAYKTQKMYLLNIKPVPSAFTKPSHSEVSSMTIFASVSTLCALFSQKQFFFSHEVNCRLQYLNTPNLCWIRKLMNWILQYNHKNITLLFVRTKFCPVSFTKNTSICWRNIWYGYSFCSSKAQTTAVA